MFLFAPLALAGLLTPAAWADEAAVSETKHEVIHANTLWDLSAHYCRDPWQWPHIYEANKSQIKNPHWIYPGQVFVIPCAGKTVAVYPKVPAEPEPAAPPPEEPAPEAKKEAAPAARPPEALSTRLPHGMTEQPLSLTRMELPKNWEPDGLVLELEGRESLAAQGDVIRVSLKDAAAAKGQRYDVYRRAGPTEADADQEGRYAQKLGVVELVRKVGKTEFLAVILKSGGTIQPEDLLKKGS